MLIFGNLFGLIGLLNIVYLFSVYQKRIRIKLAVLYFHAVVSCTGVFITALALNFIEWVSTSYNMDDPNGSSSATAIVCVSAVSIYFIFTLISNIVLWIHYKSSDRLLSQELKIPLAASYDVESNPNDILSDKTSSSGTKSIVTLVEQSLQEKYHEQMLLRHPSKISSRKASIKSTKSQ